MARIRSIHPGQWTDEDFVSLSFGARLLAIAIRNECDDQGVFEWKPLGIKMRLFAADNVDVESLLAEMVEADVCRQFSEKGKSYGAVRNFRLFQRPKKPNAQFPINDEIRIYVGLSEPDGEPPQKNKAVKDQRSETSYPPVPHQFPTGSENPPQMEDGGWREGVKEEEPNGSLSFHNDEPKPVDELSAAFNAYNASAEEVGWPKAQKFTQERRSALRARLKDVGGLTGWTEAMAKARASPHLTGQNDRGWTASLDFFLSKKSFTKLMEGNYDPKQPKPKHSGSNLLEGFRIAAERRMAGREDCDPSQPLLPARAGGSFDGSGGN